MAEHQERFPTALKELFSIEDVRTRWAESGPPDDNFFDFHDGLRLIVTREFIVDEEVIHLSASVLPDGKLHRQLRISFRDHGYDAAFMRLMAIALERYDKLDPGRQWEHFEITDKKNTPNWFARFTPKEADHDKP